MKRRTLFWLVGIGLFSLLGCGILYALTDNFNQVAQGDAVALVRIEGLILPGEGRDTNPLLGTAAAYSATVIDHLEKADQDEQIKAVVLVVDSPGGSVFASDEIALHVAKMTKPVLAAMGSMAASGGYYVSALTDEIWASPHTITCSIGVIIQFLNYDQLAADYGVESMVYKSGQFKDMGSPFRDATEEEDAIWQALIDEAYEAFVALVADGRGLNDDEVRAIADGRICTGKQALTMDLVDNLGYLPEVIQRAGELGGIEGEPPTVEYQEAPGLLEMFTSFLMRPSLIGEVRQLLELRAGAAPMYLYSDL